MAQKILITRPLDRAVETADILKAHGFEVLIEPMLTIQSINAPIDDTEYDGLIFTSRHGVEAFSKHSSYRSVKVFTVGDATKKAASRAGFDDITSANGNAKDLATLIARTYLNRTKLIHYRGPDVAQSMKELLKGAPHIHIDEQILYKALPQETLTDKLLKELENNAIGYALFYSKRTAETFVKLVQKQGCMSALCNTKALCLADSMVKSLSVLHWQDVQVAAQPTQDALLSLLTQLTEK